MNMITRRQALGLGSGVAAAIGLAACSSKSTPAPAAGASGAPGAAGPSGAPVSLPTGTIDETYQGHRIQITVGPGGHHGMAMPVVKIDGNDLHVMPNADGSWVTVVNHYETFPDPISAARAAVRELQGADLVPFVAKEAKL
ncbi:tyrosinase family oxidase copper chaperone [Streptomyces racemochromogenes]|uniref:Tyrosinase family oxidase copper chaperone n=1 Tax=Streptomyces racemochromogenes TaxID=67353 RepID=A0ABW7PFF8_9ACTN